jgi:hypothetical protein
MDIQTGTSCGDYATGSEFQLATMLCAQSSATSGKSFLRQLIMLKLLDNSFLCL